MDSPVSDGQTCIVHTDLKTESDCLISNDVGSTPLVNRRSSSETRHLKNRLRFFFMNPVQKWNIKRRLPYKFVIQVIKIFLVTFQVCIFAQGRYHHMNFSIDNQVSFSHLFIKSWDASREVLSYPPTAGPLAVYEIENFIQHVDHAVQKYANVTNISIGRFSYVGGHNESLPIHLNLEYYEDDHGLSNNDAEVIYDVMNITLPEARGFSLNQFLMNRNKTIQYQLLVLLKLKFSLKAVVYKPGYSHCSRFDVTIKFDNHEMSGQMLVSLNSVVKKLICNPNSSYARVARNEYVWQNVLNMVVMLLCSVSLVLCSRAIFNAQFLKYKTINYFRQVKKVELSMGGKLEFWNFWYIMIIINDVLIIVGSYMEGNISRNEYANEEWSICSLCLGTGNMLVWFGVLRYFGFFDKYNVVILTLKRAFPQMMRFLLCTLIIYAGFVFCGWLVLGPFHIKFRSVSRTSENLFSLVNGDDMFATFTILDSESSILWWYSRIYLYGFVSLFIYVILNLFLSVILDAYETIKEYYTHGYPKSDLQQFISEPDSEESDGETEEQADQNEGPCCFLKSVFCW